MAAAKKAASKKKVVSPRTCERCTGDMVGKECRACGPEVLASGEVCTISPMGDPSEK